MPSWEASALCAQIDPELMAPEFYRGQPVLDAKAICAGCPVVGDCLEAALAEEAGRDHLMRATVRGGLTPRERFRLEKDRAAAAA